MFCWTTRSVAPAEQALHAFAIGCKERGVYLGLLLDNVLPPAPVTGAQDIKLTDWSERNGSSGLEPLFDALDVRAGGREHSSLAGIRAAVATIFGSLRTIRARLEKLYVLAIAGALAATFAFLGGFESNVNAICRLPGVNAACRQLGTGGVASSAETAAWQAIAASRNCADFERFLQRYGRDGAFAAAAEKRLAGKKMIGGPRTNSTQVDQLYWMQPFAPTRLEALATLDRAGAARAGDLCRTQAKAFVRLLRPATMTLAGEPACEQDAAGVRCGARIEITCVFEAAGERAICPF
jgi:hypothetical protein